MLKRDGDVLEMPANLESSTAHPGTANIGRSQPGSQPCGWEERFISASSLRLSECACQQSQLSPLNNETPPGRSVPQSAASASLLHPPKRTVFANTLPLNRSRNWSTDQPKKRELIDTCELHTVL
jgi:hypothetical protein